MPQIFLSFVYFVVNLGFHPLTICPIHPLIHLQDQKNRVGCISGDANVKHLPRLDFPTHIKAGDKHRQGGYQRTFATVLCYRATYIFH